MEESRAEMEAAWGQMAGEQGSPAAPPGWDVSKKSACRCPPPPCLHVVFPVRVCVQISSSYKDTSPPGLGPHPNDHILTPLPL